MTYADVCWRTLTYAGGSNLTWRPRGGDSTQEVRESLYTNHQGAYHSTSLHFIGEGTPRMDRYGDFTLKKKIRDSRTDDTPWPHSSTLLFMTLVKSYARRMYLPSMRHGGTLSRQDYTPISLNIRKSEKVHMALSRNLFFTRKEKK
jgi:hypothetical protein